jgi:NAD(P)H-dependent FMN reductase
LGLLHPANPATAVWRRGRNTTTATTSPRATESGAEPPPSRITPYRAAKSGQGNDRNDQDYPPEAVALKDAIAKSDAILLVTPEFNRSIPGALKNAIDWASRPWGQNDFDDIPAAVIGASIGQIGTAVAQQRLRAVLSFCNARQMTAPEAHIHYSPEVFADDGEVTKDATVAFLRGFMSEFLTMSLAC